MSSSYFRVINYGLIALCFTGCSLLFSLSPSPSSHINSCCLLFFLLPTPQTQKHNLCPGKPLGSFRWAIKPTVLCGFCILRPQVYSVESVLKVHKIHLIGLVTCSVLLEEGNLPSLSQLWWLLSSAWLGRIARKYRGGGCLRSHTHTHIHKLGSHAGLFWATMPRVYVDLWPVLGRDVFQQQCPCRRWKSAVTLFHELSPDLREGFPVSRHTNVSWVCLISTQP